MLQSVCEEECVRARAHVCVCVCLCVRLFVCVCSSSSSSSSRELARGGNENLLGYKVSMS